MRLTTTKLAAATFSLNILIACVSDTGTTIRNGGADGGATADTGTSAADTGSGDTGPGPQDDGGPERDGGPRLTKCSDDQVFDDEKQVTGGGGVGTATWFSSMPGEGRAYYVAIGKLYGSTLSGSVIASPIELAGKADAVSATLDTTANKPLLAYRGSPIDVNTYITWDEGAALSQNGTQIDGFIHPNLMHDGKHMVARFDNNNGAGGDQKIYEFLITADYANKTIAYQQQSLVVDEPSLYPVYSFDGLSLIYVSSQTGLMYRTRTAIGAPFTGAVAIKHATNILASAHPHSLSPDRCRLYFTRGAGAFIASRKPDLL